MINQKWNKTGFFLGWLVAFGLTLSGSVGASVQKKSSCELVFKKKHLCAQVNWVVAPQSVELPTEKDTAEFTLTFFKKGSNPKVPVSTPPAESVYVKLFMPSMGHGSHPTQVTEAKDEKGNPVPGTYQVKNVLFSMPGDWLIQVQLKQAGKVLDQADLPFEMR